MYACIYCMRIYVCAYTYVYMHVCIYVCMCAYMYVYMQFLSWVLSGTGGLVVVGRGIVRGNRPGIVRRYCPGVLFGGECPFPVWGFIGIQTSTNNAHADQRPVEKSRKRDKHRHVMQKTKVHRKTDKKIVRRDEGNNIKARNKRRKARD